MLDRDHDPAPDLLTPVRFMGSDEQDRGWEQRALLGLLATPALCCFHGFMGAVHERLVRKGLATREDAGYMDPLRGVSEEIQATKKFKAHVRGYLKDPFPQFTYTITEAGVATAEAIRRG